MHHHPPQSLKPHIWGLISHLLFKDKVLCGPFLYKMCGNRAWLKLKLVRALLNFLNFLNFVVVIYFVQKSYVGDGFAVYYHRIFAGSMHCLKESLSLINRTGAKESTRHWAGVGRGSSLGFSVVISSKEQWHCCSQLSLSMIG